MKRLLLLMLVLGTAMVVNGIFKSMVTKLASDIAGVKN